MASVCRRWLEYDLLLFKVNSTFVFLPRRFITIPLSDPSLLIIIIVLLTFPHFSLVKKEQGSQVSISVKVCTTSLLSKKDTFSVNSFCSCLSVLLLQVLVKFWIGYTYVNGRLGQWVASACFAAAGATAIFGQSLTRSIMLCINFCFDSSLTVVYFASPLQGSRDYPGALTPAVV